MIEVVNKKKMKGHRVLFAGLSLFLLAVVLTVNFPQAISGFVGDLAVYLCMGQSLALDHDLEYTKGDLARIYKEWGVGPGGVFLKKTGSKIFYAKPLIYPLFAAPLVLTLHTNGFLLLNVVCLLWCILLGYWYFRCYNEPFMAMCGAISFFVLCISFVYAFTVVPEVFNMALVTSGLFFIFYPRLSLRIAMGRRIVCVQKPLSPPWRYLFAAIFLGLATFSKLTNAILFLCIPLQLWLHDDRGTKPVEASREAKQNETQAFTTPVVERNVTRLWYSAISLVVMCAVVLSFFALQYAFTGEMNPQGGNRKVFHHPQWPFNEPGRTFENGGFPISPERTISLNRDAGFLKKMVAFIIQRARFTDLRMLSADVIYFFIGRFGGLLPFFPMALLALGMAMWKREKRAIAILLPVGTTVLLFFLVMPQNYVGGAALGNRYFINSYPALLFLITRLKSGKALAATWLIGCLFLGPALLTPFQTNYNIGNFGTSFPYTLLPLEQSLVANYPTNVDPKLHFVPFSENPTKRHIPGQNNRYYHITFADHNTYGYEWAMEREGFWVRGESRSEFILRYPGTCYDATFIIQNGSSPNRITLSVDGHGSHTEQFNSGELRRFTFHITHPFPYFGHSLLKCVVTSASGFIPRFDTDPASTDIRFLGCYVSIQTTPCAERQSKTAQ